MMGDGIKVDSEGKGDGPGTQAKAREGPFFLCDMGLGQADIQAHPWRQTFQQTHTATHGPWTHMWEHHLNNSQVGSNSQSEGL